METATPEILLVEDNPGDVLLTREAFNQTKIPCHLSVVGNGAEAIRFLCRQGDYGTAPRPDLILLDLHLPRKAGHELLAEIKSDAHLKAIPVVVLTTSVSESDIAKAYSLHANSYIAKPTDLDGLCAVVEAIARFWLQVVVLPPKEC